VLQPGSMEVIVYQRESDDDPRVCYACGRLRPTQEEDLLDSIKQASHRDGNHGRCSEEECEDASSGLHTILVTQVFIPSLADCGFAFGYTRRDLVPAVVMLSLWETLDLQDSVLRTGAPVEVTEPVVATGNTATEMASRWTRQWRTGSAGRAA
jgi:hypothetical protein